MDRRSRVSSMAALAVLVAAISTSCTDGYTFGPAHLSKRSTSKIGFKTAHHGQGIHKRRADGSAVTLYLFPTPPSVISANHHRRGRSRSTSPTTPSGRQSKTSLPAMSTSILSPSDVLPSFHTAHGLLSPEVVMRIADSYGGDIEANGTLHKFLKLYRTKGPMACVSLLSDGDVLPELTRAMREIA